MKKQLLLLLSVALVTVVTFYSCTPDGSVGMFGDAYSLAGGSNPSGGGDNGSGSGGGSGGGSGSGGSYPWTYSCGYSGSGGTVQIPRGSCESQYKAYFESGACNDINTMHQTCVNLYNCLGQPQYAAQCP